jgi:hypothetical protein
VVDLKTGVETPHGKHKVFLPMNDDSAPPWVYVVTPSYLTSLLAIIPLLVSTLKGNSGQ